MTNKGANATIFGGAGEDKITNSGGYAYIDGGEDSDYIETSAGVGVTIDGGSGTDTFFYGKTDGNDVIQNAKQSDVVNLYNVRLSDITSANVTSTGIVARFSTGNSLTINNSSALTSSFKLADGSSWRYNRSLGRWQNS